MYMLDHSGDSDVVVRYVPGGLHHPDYRARNRGVPAERPAHVDPGRRRRAAWDWYSHGHIAHETARPTGGLTNFPGKIGTGRPRGLPVLHRRATSQIVSRQRDPTLSPMPSDVTVKKAVDLDCTTVLSCRLC